MNDALIGAAIALVLVAALVTSGALVGARRLWRWLVQEFHL